MQVKIIIVGYNEEANLEKLFSSLGSLRGLFDFQTHYIDQSSTDRSVSIARKFADTVLVKENKGYADPDKKWAVENLVEDWEWCLLLDADEEVTRELGEELRSVVQEAHVDACMIGVKVYYLWNSYVLFRQLRFFLKKAVKLSDEIHNYISLNTENITVLQASILNRDNRQSGNQIYLHLEKINRYSEKELVKYENARRSAIYFGLFFKPLLTFLQWWCKFGLFFHWSSWFIVSVNMAYYTFVIYSKLYERHILPGSEKIIRNTRQTESTNS